MTIDRGVPPQPGGHRGGRTVTEGGEATPADGRLLLTLQAFCETHERAWHGFALTQVGSDQDAALVVAGMKAHLRQRWALALRQEIPATYAWRLLKEHVAAWMLHTGRRQPALLESAVLDTVVRRLRAGRPGDGRRELPEGRGLHTAILGLPERQHDVIVLRYVLDMDEEEIAQYLGRPAATVRSHLRHAHRNLARALELPEPADSQGAP
ncbi:RNA polymerase sigma factor [Kitasatospora sp. NPDC052896]|uniref:RNA polymerase sigma factor n=1 Tax=Kitasatospora sp. NPDC052896 TaxID=3364061 RepID=UPI0037C61C2E